MKTYIDKEMKGQRADDHPIYFDHYDPEALREILFRPLSPER